MNTLTKSPAVTAANVSRILKQRFDRSKTHATRVQGWTHTTTGFTSSTFNDTVIVKWEITSSFHRDVSEAISQKNEKLFQMLSYLQDLGFDARLVGVGYHVAISITK